MSARYSIVPKEYYEPGELRGQSQVNHQGSEGVVNINQDGMHSHLEKSFDIYEKLLEDGCCREQARGNLPQSTYTEFYWKINLHNLMHYLHLRMDSHAQKEIQDYARDIYDLIEPLVPITMRAFKDFRVDAIQLTGPEIRALKHGEIIKSPGERREYEAKLEALGLKDKNLNVE
jgi:thymidylate synthase (FAD)